MPGFKKYFILPLYILLSVHCIGQPADTLTIKSLLQSIAALQSEHASDFPDGGFISYRKYQYSNEYKLDYNSFFAALVLYNINRYKDYLTPEEYTIAEQMKAKCLPYFELFKDKKNKLIYNFWPKYPPVCFPNGGWLNLLNKADALSDDIDDCSMINLAIGISKLQADSLKHCYLQVINGKNKHSNGFYKHYQQSPVYSTWLGAKMNIDIDLCVLCNAVLFSYNYHLPLTQTDTASMNLIVDMVQQRKYITDAGYVSMHYENTSTIIYHIARLIHFSNYPPLLALKPQLIKEARKRLATSPFALEKLLLQNALLQLGDRDPALIPTNRSELLSEDYPFFIANMAAITINPFKRIFKNSKIGRFSYYSYAFNLSLLFENKVLWQRVFKLQ